MWLQIRIGERPNNRAAWVPTEKVLLETIDLKIIISVGNRTMTMFRNGKKAWKPKVVVGKQSTPTPRGLFAVHDFYRATNDLRPWIVETTAHSEVLRTFEGGPGRVAIHGRHGKLRVPWGSAASNGCIRTPDWALRWIRRRAPV
ncbi:MAG: L,D-transpeptidase, partial [Solirubrobacterales bacterium]